MERDPPESLAEPQVGGCPNAPRSLIKLVRLQCRADPREKNDKHDLVGTVSRHNPGRGRGGGWSLEAEVWDELVHQVVVQSVRPL